jgi:hypothetical protein
VEGGSPAMERMWWVVERIGIILPVTW